MSKDSVQAIGLIKNGKLKVDNGEYRQLGEDPEHSFLFKASPNRLF